MPFENLVSEIIKKLELKRKEAEGFVLKYKTRDIKDLEEYYKGVKWALDYAIKNLSELKKD